MKISPYILGSMLLCTNSAISQTDSLKKDSVHTITREEVLKMPTPSEFLNLRPRIESYIWTPEYGPAGELLNKPICRGCGMG